MMAIRRTPLLVGEIYHIYNRGVDKRIIFLDEHDHRRFMALLYLCNSANPVDMRALLSKGLPFADIFSVDKGEEIVHIGAYCLMPNHFHILVRERVPGGATRFMEKLSTAYSMYFNRRYERTGRLFEGPFKSRHIDTEPYLNWVFSYIHLNPVKLIDSNWKESGISDPEKACGFMKNYMYSSYYDYFVEDRPESAILSKDSFPEHFARMNDFGELVQEFRNNE